MQSGLTSAANQDDGILSGVIEIISATGNLSGLTSEQDFYDAGVTSVMALPILLDIEDRYGVRIPDELFVSARTPLGLAELVAKSRKA